MVMGHVCGQTLKITVKNLLAPLEIHVKIGWHPCNVYKNLTIPCEDTAGPYYTVQTYFVKSSQVWTIYIYFFKIFIYIKNLTKFLDQFYSFYF